jgi:Tfp pilus assembly protein PilO
MKKFTTFSLNKFPVLQLLIPILITVFYLILLFRSTVKILFHNLAKANKLKTEIIATEKEWANIKSLENKILLAKEKIDNYEKKLPREKDIPTILEYLSDSARKFNVRIVEIKPIKQGKNNKKQNSIYYTVPISLKAECGYHQLGRFLNKLEKANRFMKINDIEIEATSSRGNMLEVHLIIATYVMSPR